LLKRIKEVEADMMVKARDLQFEQAAKLRDEVKRLKEALLMQQV
jgi:excinuclease ABC subunit B